MKFGSADLVLGIRRAIAKFHSYFLSLQFTQKDRAGDIESVAGVQLGHFTVTDGRFDTNLTPKPVQPLTLGRQAIGGLGGVCHQRPVVG